LIEDVKIVRFPVLDTEQWRYVANERTDAFAAFIRTEKPKMILLCAPDNPTSQLPSTAFVQAALEAAREVGSFLVIDFAYKALVWGDTVPEYFSWGPNENYLSIHSNSKWCRGLGRRLGWVEAPIEIIEALEAMQGSSILCPDTLHQMALSDYIADGISNNSIKPYIRQTADLYQAAAQRTVEAIEKHVKMPCLLPQGGLYTVLRTDEEGSEFTRKVLENTGVIVVPGWGFGETLRQAVRLSYGPLVHNLEKIEEAMRRIGTFLDR
jgi:aspartate/methionine/tyrosine aminotransferase